MKSTTIGAPRSPSAPSGTGRLWSGLWDHQGVLFKYPEPCPSAVFLFLFTVSHTGMPGYTEQ